MWEHLDSTDKRIDRSGAMNTAMAHMVANAAGGRSERGRMAVGFGTQNGQGALSIGYGRRIGERASMTFGGAVSGSDSSAGVGLGFDL
ncbi:YadA-like family protein [Pseudoxanthomonas sp. NC8]|nr:YadA-like family protein [Pseudoxanthomonas sp. NC8]